MRRVPSYRRCLADEGVCPVRVSLAVDPGETALGDSKNRFLALLKARGDDPVIVAHRGDSFHAPENTLEAARLAWEAGADAWELDVQLTRDGVPIVLHDESLLRTTDVATRFKDDPRGQAGFRVSDFDFSEIRALDAGSWFVAADGGRSLRACVRHARPSRAGVGRTLPLRPGDHPHAGRGTPLDGRAGLAGERRDQVVPREPAGPGRTGARGHRPDRHGIAGA